jgi:hypothetical protein
MTHKDWKGPGWYRRWNEDGKYDGFGEKRNNDHLCSVWHYEKLEDFEPPKPPKEKLADGWYIVLIENKVKQRRKEGNKAFGTGGYPSFDNCVNRPTRWDEYEVIGRIPVEPVEE